MGLKNHREELQIILDSVPAIIFYKDRENRLVRVNKAFVDLFGMPREELEGSSLFDLLPERAEEYWKDDKEVMVSGRPKGNIIEPVETSRGTRWVQTDKIPYVDEDGNIIGVIGFSLDITERKQAEEELRFQSEMFSNITEGICLVRASDTKIVYANPIFEQIFGYDSGEILGKHISTVNAPTDKKPEETTAEVKEILNKAGEWHGEINNIKKDGSLFWCQVNVSTFDHPDFGKVFISVHTDITERKRAEKKLLEYQKKLKNLASALLLAEERERHRIATELHDSIAQTLAIAKIKLGSFIADEPAADLVEVNELIDQAIQDTRSLIFEISPPILYDVGLEAAVEWLCEQVESQHGVKCLFIDNGQAKPVEDDVRVLLFQAARELLLNVVKHAAARSAKVSVSRQDRNMLITIEDDGIGFDPGPVNSRVNGNGGFGLFSIRERLSHIGGRLEIESGDGRGTVATLIAPTKA